MENLPEHPAAVAVAEVIGAAAAVRINRVVVLMGRKVLLLLVLRLLLLELLLELLELLELSLMKPLPLKNSPLPPWVASLIRKLELLRLVRLLPLPKLIERTTVSLPQ